MMHPHRAHDIESGADGVAGPGTPRLVFINRFFHPDHSATSQMLSAVAFALARRGWRVSVITSRQVYDAPGAVLPDAETIEGVDVWRVQTTRRGRSGLVGRSLDYLTFYAAASRRLERFVQPGDIVIAKTDPPLLSVPIGRVAARRGALLVNWLQDLFPEVAESIGLGGGLLGPAYAGLRRARDRSLLSSACNVAISDGMAERLGALGVPRARIRVLSNMADGRSIRPVAPAANTLRQDWGLADAFVVGYSGNLGRAHEFETVLSAISAGERAVASRGARPVRWLFIGGGSGNARLKAQVERRGLRSVRFEPYQPEARLAESLSVADVHLVSLKPELEGLIVPSKIYGIMAAGRPAVLIGDAEGEIAHLLRLHGCGLAVRQGDGQGLIDAVERLRGDAVACGAMGQAARAAFEQHYDSGVVTKQWHVLFAQLAGQPAQAAGGEQRAHRAQSRHGDRSH